MENQKLAKATSNQSNLLAYPNIKPGYVTDSNMRFDYPETIKQCRYYYETDAIAGTVINRMVEIAITSLKNRRKSVHNNKKIDDEALAYYNVVADRLIPFLKACALAYLLDGMALPEFTLSREMGSRTSDYLGRTRYYFPHLLWCRNPDNITLKKKSQGNERFVYLTIPSDDINLVKNKGKDGREDEYNDLVTNFPEYVQAINEGKTRFLLKDIYPVYRKLTSYNTYPLPYLKNSLAPMAHKEHLKKMDRAIASRAIEAIRHISVGDKDYPADDDDIDAVSTSLMQNANSGERVFNWFTNHTVKIAWNFPPMEALLNDAKYIGANLDIFIALGFPRIWTNGETERSNAADNATASVGPIATLNDMRSMLLLWVKYFYLILADKNNFLRVPEPYFAPISMADVANLIQYGAEYVTNGSISRNTISNLYGTDYATEMEQRTVEQENETVLQPVNTPPNNDPANPEKSKLIIGDNKSPTKKDGDGDGNRDE